MAPDRGDGPPAREPLRQAEAPDAPSEKPGAPDGGYGWVVVAASFTMGLIVDGCLFTFGIMTMEFVDFFNTNKMTIALAGSVMNGVYLSVGPVVSGLCNRFGCRAVAFAGSLVAATGFVTCVFSQDVGALIVTYGAVAGIGFGMMHLPSIVMVGFYFNTKRAFATGIAMCGSGIGAFIFAPVIQLLLGVYDWRGAQLILAGIVLQGCILGLLFRPLKKALPTPLELDSVETTDKYQSQTLLHQSQNLAINDCSNISKISSLSLNSASEDRHCRKLVGTKLRKELIVSSSVASIPYTVREEGSVKCGTSKRRDNGTEARCYDSLVDFVNCSLLKSLTFDLYGLSCFLVMAGFFIPFMFLPELAVSQGMSRNSAALLLSIIGIANTVGRVICGWVSDRPWANCLVVNISALMMGGVALMLVPAFKHVFALLCLSSAMFGLSIAVFASLRSIIMVELMGLDKLTDAFGLVTFFQGLSTFIGNPMAGALYDATGNYDTLFYVAGGLLILAGLACVPCRYLAARKMVNLNT